MANERYVHVHVKHMHSGSIMVNNGCFKLRYPNQNVKPTLSNRIRIIMIHIVSITMYRIKRKVVLRMYIKYNNFHIIMLIVCGKLGPIIQIPLKFSFLLFKCSVVVYNDISLSFLSCNGNRHIIINNYSLRILLRMRWLSADLAWTGCLLSQSDSLGCVWL